MFFSSLLHQIKWEGRLKGDVGRVCKISVDGTDFLVKKQWDNQASWISHKFKKPAVRYELGVCIQTGDIVWFAGPFRAGRFADLTIFRCGGLKKLLLATGERAEADLGYRGEPSTIDLPDDGCAYMYCAKKLVRQRHETVNKRLKNWACLKTTFRHEIGSHEDYFTAVVVMTQLEFNFGLRPFQVEY